MKKIINNLPDRFKWTIHNVFAHPASELLFQFGFKDLSELVHDYTMPEEDDV